MQSFIEIEGIDKIENNSVIGQPKEMKNSKIEFHGENNILFFDESVVLDNSTIRFLGDNNLVFVSNSGNHKTKIKVDIYNNSVFYLGKNCNTTRPIHVVLSERKHIFIGDDCLFSFDVWFRNADPHLIYDGSTKKRINPSKSVFLGDHVWVGQEAFVSKGTKIGSGSIIGAKSVTGGKTLPSNCSCAGVPCKVIKDDIFWLKPSVHAYDEEKSKESMECKKDTYLYSENGKQIDFDKLDDKLDGLKTSEDRLEYLKKHIFENNDKNRFYIPKQKKKRKLFFSK